MPTLIVATSVVDGDSLNTSDLLKLKHRIPPYQRDYVWTRKVVEQLWDDLINHYRQFSENEKLIKPEGYFLGAMVVVEEASEQRFEVVDGQQRLTSLTTVISVLLDFLNILDVPQPNRKGYENVALDCLGKFVGGGWETNLSFSDPDVASFFINSCLTNIARADKNKYWETAWCVDKLARKSSAIYRIHEAIECGYEKMSAFIDELSTLDEKRDRLTSFFMLVTECVVILKITAHSHSNAYAIFESLNNRGIRLSQADLIKNELLKVAMSSERDEIIENWSYARQYVDSTEVLTLPDFLHFSYLSRHNKVKANDLYENVRAYVSSSGGVALTYSKELYEDAAALDALTSSFDAAWTAETSFMLNDIKNVLGIKLCYPYLFAVFRRHATNKVEFENHVRLVMNFAFRYLKVMEEAVEQLAGAINEAAMAVNQGKLKADIAAIFRKYAPDSQFLSKLETASFANTKLAYFTVYYLEKVMLSGTIPLPHGQEQNLEHIMPRTPTKTYWPKIAKEKEGDPEMFRDYLWRIGNLLPLPETINKSLKNKDINFKISNGSGNEYSAKKLTLVSPKEVAKYLDGAEWTYKSIEKRQYDLVHSYAAQAWAL